MSNKRGIYICWGNMKKKIIWEWATASYKENVLQCEIICSQNHMHRLGVACGQGLGDDGRLSGCCVRSRCAVWQRWWLEWKMGRGGASLVGFTRCVRWVLLLYCAAVESEVRWCLCGDDDRPRVVCRVLGRRKTCIIPMWNSLTESELSVLGTCGHTSRK
jgi:hypothetical protein